MALNAAVPNRLSDILEELGRIAASRVRSEPAPGKATIADLIRVNVEGCLCELVDGILVQKACGWKESLIVAALIQRLRQFVEIDNQGLIIGPDACFEIFRTLVRSPSVSFVSWSRLPEGKIPTTPVPQVVPDLAIEILSTGNTFMEMSRKRHEYFHAGVRLVWMVDPRERTVAVYTSASEYQMLDERQILTGHDVLPGLEINLADVFAELDRCPPPT